ncbi:MAG: type II toxin-antitoxin system RelE/ParE family toxin [Synergistaceae bacterium]|nr:type II toxin-antitoxin system RelE/ParE family toxin [Synergistaceae bacterium]
MPQIVGLLEREFKVAYKRLYPDQKAAVNEAVREIVDNPVIGEEKKGDLKGVFVHKFKCLDRQFLLAYTWDPATRTLIALGVHENFYRDAEGLSFKLLQQASKRGIRLIPSETQSFRS